MSGFIEAGIYVILVIAMDFALFNYAKIYFSAGDARNDSIQFRPFEPFKLIAIVATVAGMITSKSLFAGEIAIYLSLIVIMIGILAVLTKSYLGYLANRDR